MRNMIAITQEDWYKLTEYVEDTNPSFYKAEKAVEVQRIFRGALTITLNEPAKETVQSKDDN